MDKSIKKNTKTICFVAGKSGGHIIPCLTLAHQAIESDNVQIIFISTESSLDKRIINADTLHKKHITIPLGTRSYKWYQMLILMWHGLYSVIKSLYVMIKYRPSQVISTGGMVSIPVCMAAYVAKIPISVYELNAVPGKAVTYLSYLATHVYVCFRSAQRYFKKNAIVVPYPIRFTKRLVNSSKNSTLFTICIVGGSQGSIGINRLLYTWLEQNTHMHQYVSIIHQTGSNDSYDWLSIYKSFNITAQVFDFRPSLEDVYAKADLVISRAGAGTLFELLFFNVPSLIIPLQSITTSHQKDNAYAMAHDYPSLFTVMLEQDILADQTEFHAYLNDCIMTHIKQKQAMESPEDHHYQPQSLP